MYRTKKVCLSRDKSQRSPQLRRTSIAMLRVRYINVSFFQLSRDSEGELIVRKFANSLFHTTPPLDMVVIADMMEPFTPHSFSGGIVPRCARFPSPF